MMTAGLQVSTPTDTTILFTRVFRAPRHLVWNAMTKPDLVQRWMFCPPDWSWGKCEMDVRVGGKFRWEWNGPNGQTALSIWGEYREVKPHSRIVHTERMEMGPGAGGACGGATAADTSATPEPWELLAALELGEQNGSTVMTMTLTFASKAARDGALASGMEHGMEAGYAQLDAQLAQ